MVVVVAFPFSISAVATTERRRDAGRRNRRPRAACGAASATPASTAGPLNTRASAAPANIAGRRRTCASARPASIAEPRIMPASVEVVSIAGPRLTVVSALRVSIVGRQNIAACVARASTAGPRHTIASVALICIADLRGASARRGESSRVHAPPPKHSLHQNTPRRRDNKPMDKCHRRDDSHNKDYSERDPRRAVLHPPQRLRRRPVVAQADVLE